MYMIDFYEFQYFEGHMTDLDLLIVGGFYGDGGGLQKKITSFLLAVYSETEGNFICKMRTHTVQNML